MVRKVDKLAGPEKQRVNLGIERARGRGRRGGGDVVGFGGGAEEGGVATGVHHQGGVLGASEGRADGDGEGEDTDSGDGGGGGGGGCGAPDFLADVGWETGEGGEVCGGRWDDRSWGHCC